ncbi:nadph dehydrogenase [Lasallia pustulata]|uniref:Nadph dehydrogenase n=1 Tax=Lasallia pustulata TaxID=136370 RepID=A0A1W5D262_9LECA|nr:nadph dehydrogenase [Lasallia pustulata]
MPLCPSSVPVKFGDGWLDKMALDKVLRTPKEMTIKEIDAVVADWVRGAVVAKEAGFAKYFRSRVGMADAIQSGACQLIGLGRTAVLDPDISKSILLNPSVPDDVAFAPSHIVKGQWFAKLIPVKVIGSCLAIQFFYHNMRRLGNGLKSDRDVSIPSIVFHGIVETFQTGLLQAMERVLQSLPLAGKAKGE